MPHRQRQQEVALDTDTVVLFCAVLGAMLTLGSRCFRLPKLKRFEGKAPRNGVTLIELIVVLGLIAVLASMILPAVHQARESVRLVSCKNNLRQIGLSLTQHESFQRSYPSCGWTRFWTSLSDRSGEGQPGGWIYEVLPYLEQKSLHAATPSSLDLINNRFDSFVRVAKVPIAMFKCPSKIDRSILLSSTDMVFGRLDFCQKPDYALSGGPMMQNVFWEGPLTLADAAASSFKWPKEQEQGIARRRFGRKVQQITDGLSNTLLVGEKKIPALTDSRRTSDNQPYFTGFGADTVRWTSDPSSDDFSFRNDTEAGGDFAFGGPHTGQTLIMRCDGSVESVSNSIDAKTLYRLGHISDGLALDLSN